jgi:8-oxo-dGTP pyrophosphatase MutT (NUDIX family)
VLTLDEVRQRLQSHAPSLAARGEQGQFEAAVAVILREIEPRRPELLLIERAEREGDPWSGQMAFPGGRRHADDPDLARTAARETREEVGLLLEAPPIARLDDVEGSRASRPQRVVVAPFVYALAEQIEVTPNHEVRSAVWVPVAAIADPGSGTLYRFEREGFTGTFPAIRYQGYTVWGLTYRILRQLFEQLGHPLLPPGS